MLLLLSGIWSVGLGFDYIWLLDVLWLGRDFRAACRDLATVLDWARTLWMMNPSLHSAFIFLISVIWMKMSPAHEQSLLSSGTCLIMDKSTCLLPMAGQLSSACRGVWLNVLERGRIAWTIPHCQHLGVPQDIAPQKRSTLGELHWQPSPGLRHTD